MDEKEILDNIDGRMHGPMPGFIAKFFGEPTCTHRDNGLEVQSAAPTPESFLPWFLNFVSEKYDGNRASWHTFSNTVTANHEQSDMGTSLLLTMPPSPTPNAQTRWSHAQVIGQFYQDEGVGYQHALVRLCQSAQQVFASQPTRLFLHGFYIRGSQMELWVFDRSGLYCSEVFDVQKDFDQFVFIMLRYGQMTDEQLGTLQRIKTDEEGSYITLENVANSNLAKLYLESQPIACRQGLVGTGTTCYRAKPSGSNRWNYVLKFKWRWARHRPEDELLRLAQEKCGRFASEQPADSRRRGVEGLRQPTGLADYTEKTDNYFQNRILTCAVTSPAGRPLHTFRSLLELLQVFRHAVQCHRSLYRDAEILHRDISAGNMIILDNQEGGAKGMLIDLDVAIHLGTELDRALGITGTRPFMAIGVLKGHQNTYRHDLEAFFYVFLWTIITNRADGLPEASRLRQWSRGTQDESAARKSRDIACDGFEGILGEFALEFHPLKPLAERLRRILFPLREGTMWIGTDTDAEAVDELYGQVICAFEEAILGLESRE
ncbi:serine/threonine-protein kinase Sgk2 [Metarhizium guizhouense ARSEF 977]|uniref:non-specific serine/threonine protein kinase n=1 Tax=Metarhizium guizhouense (strain ARSEF 977) TaxID=1276136 RepID=A0A0B4G4V9_METGA|nr:serine/threonine-protein kinase Sgk2 [Metarhizium guizhouense ARSEF 977]